MITLMCINPGYRSGLMHLQNLLKPLGSLQETQMWSLPLDAGHGGAKQLKRQDNAESAYNIAYLFAPVGLPDKFVLPFCLPSRQRWLACSNAQLL